MSKWKTHTPLRNQKKLYIKRIKKYLKPSKKLGLTRCTSGRLRDLGTYWPQDLTMTSPGDPRWSKGLSLGNASAKMSKPTGRPVQIQAECNGTPPGSSTCLWSPAILRLFDVCWCFVVRLSCASRWSACCTFHLYWIWRLKLSMVVVGFLLPIQFNPLQQACPSLRIAVWRIAGLACYTYANHATHCNKAPKALALGFSRPSTAKHGQARQKLSFPSSHCARCNNM